MPQRAKIAVVIPKYGLIGGAEQFARELTEGLSRTGGCRISILANQWKSDSGGVEFRKVHLISFPKFLTTISFAQFAARSIAAGDFDIVHTHERIFHADFVTLHGLPHRIWIRDVRQKSPSLFDLGTAWVEDMQMRDAKPFRFLAVSTVVKQKYLAHYEGLDPDRIVVFHPGVDAEKIQKLDRDSNRAMLKQKLGISGDCLLALFVSMNFEVKGLDRVMAGFAALNSGRPGRKFCLLVAGKGDETRYKRLAQQLGIPDKVKFLGAVAKRDLDRVYRGCDIYVMLSRFDTFGMAALEAMAASLPVLISGNVGAKDIVKNGVNGYVINDVEDSEEIAETLNLLFDHDHRSRMAEQALITAKSNSWQERVRQLEGLYREFLNAKESGPS